MSATGTTANDGSNTPPPDPAITQRGTSSTAIESLQKQNSNTNTNDANTNGNGNGHHAASGSDSDDGKTQQQRASVTFGGTSVVAGDKTSSDLSKKKQLEEVLRRASEELKAARKEVTELKEENEKLKKQVADQHSARQISAGTSAVVKELQDLRVRVRELLEKNLALDAELRESQKSYGELQQRYEEKQRALLALASTPRGDGEKQSEPTYAEKHQLQQAAAAAAAASAQGNRSKSPLGRLAGASARTIGATGAASSTSSQPRPVSPSKQGRAPSYLQSSINERSVRGSSIAGTAAASTNSISSLAGAAATAAASANTGALSPFSKRRTIGSGITAPVSGTALPPPPVPGLSSARATATKQTGPISSRSSTRSATPNSIARAAAASASSVASGRSRTPDNRIGSVPGSADHHARRPPPGPNQAVAHAAIAAAAIPAAFQPAQQQQSQAKTIGANTRSATPPPPKYPAVAANGSGPLSSDRASRPATTTTTIVPTRVSATGAAGSATKPANSSGTAGAEHRSASVERTEADRAVSAKHYNEVMLSRLRRAIAPPPTKEQLGEVVHAMVEELQKSLARHGAVLPFRKKEPCVYWCGQKKLHLAVDSGRLVVKSGGGHTDLLEYMERHKICSTLPQVEQQQQATPNA